MIRSKNILSILLVVVFLAVTGMAWNPEIHRAAIRGVTRMYLTPEASRTVQRLLLELSNEDFLPDVDQSKMADYQRRTYAEVREISRTAAALARANMIPEALAEAATLPDLIRLLPGWQHTFPQHYENIHNRRTLTGAGLDQLDAMAREDADCALLHAIALNAYILGDPANDDLQRARALVFLVHFLEDATQPFHVNDAGDRGGSDTKVVYLGVSKTSKGGKEIDLSLHHIWDGHLFLQASPGTSADILTLYWAKRFSEIAEQEAKNWQNTTLRDVVEGSFTAGTAARRHPDGSPIKTGDNLGQDYGKQHLPVAEKRAALAGYFVARELNRLLAGPR